MIEVLSKEELAHCNEFSDEVGKSQQRIEFGQNTTSKRSFKEISRDTLIGKLAEVAVSNFLKREYCIDVPLDFGIYPRGQWDGNDIEVNGWMADIKSSRSGSRWLLVEKNKINFRRKDGDLPHIFIMCITGWNRTKDAPTGEVDIKGFYFTHMLLNGSKGVLELGRGDCIPYTNCRLQASNYGIHVDNLLQDKSWRIFNKLKKNKCGIKL